MNEKSSFSSNDFEAKPIFEGNTVSSKNAELLFVQKKRCINGAIILEGGTLSLNDATSINFTQNGV